MNMPVECQWIAIRQ